MENAMVPMVQHKLFFVQENFSEFLIQNKKTDHFLLKINCYQEVKIALTRDANLQRMMQAHPLQFKSHRLHDSCSLFHFCSRKSPNGQPLIEGKNTTE
jgi:hypothetical protein